MTKQLGRALDTSPPPGKLGIALHPLCSPTCPLRGLSSTVALSQPGFPLPTPGRGGCLEPCVGWMDGWMGWLVRSHTWIPCNSGHGMPAMAGPHPKPRPHRVGPGVGLGLEGGGRKLPHPLPAHPGTQGAKRSSIRTQLSTFFLRIFKQT